MPDMWMDVDAALSEVPVNIFPLTDDTDFKTREESVAYNQAGLDLVWNFVTTAGEWTQTAVTPTTGGVHDWTNQGNGMYSIEIPASAGTINNDTEGFGWFVGYATGVLPWRGPIIGFRAAALNNAEIDGGDYLDVNVVQWLGTAAASPTTAGIPKVEVWGYRGYDASVDAGGVPEVSVARWNGVNVHTPTTGGIPIVEIHDPSGVTIGTVTTLTNAPTDMATATELAKVPKSDGTTSWNTTAMAAMADAFLDRNLGTGTDSGGRTVRNALRPSVNMVVIADSVMTVYKENDETVAWTAAVAGTAGASPLTSINPG